MIRDHLIAQQQNDDAAVKIKFIRTYTNNFEKAANWPKLLELMDAFYNFSTQKFCWRRVNSILIFL